MVVCVLLAASVGAGCAGSDDCRTFPDTPRIVHLYASSAGLDAVAGKLEQEGWAIHADVHGARDRVYAVLDGAPRIVLAYYTVADATRSSLEVFALNVSSDSDARTREILAPASSALATLNATLGRPTEVSVEGLTRACASEWVPEGCEPGPRQTARAPWEIESAPTPGARDECLALMVD